MSELLDTHAPYGSSKASREIREDYKTRQDTYSTNPVYNDKVGAPAPLAVYVNCQYASLTQLPTDGKPAQATQCTNRALMVPGYHRACAEHMLHQLLRSVAEFVQKPVSNLCSDTEKQALVNLTRQLTMTTDGTLDRLLQAEEAARTLAIATEAKKERKPRAKRTTTVPTA